MFEFSVATTFGDAAEFQTPLTCDASPAWISGATQAVLVHNTVGSELVFITSTAA